MMALCLQFVHFTGRKHCVVSTDPIGLWPAVGGFYRPAAGSGHAAAVAHGDPVVYSGCVFYHPYPAFAVRLFRDMVSAVGSKKPSGRSLSSFQTLVVSTATRVGMGNLVGVVAAVSAGGAGAVFWMWLTALLGASTAFVESTLAQKYKQPDPCMAGTGAGRLIISINWPSVSGARLCAGRWWQRCLRCPV